MKKLLFTTLSLFIINTVYAADEISQYTFNATITTNKIPNNTLKGSKMNGMSSTTSTITVKNITKPGLTSPMSSISTK